MLAKNFPGEYAFAAEAYSPQTGIVMTVYTTAPGVQLYTGNWLGDEHAKDDANYGWGAGFALEAEMYPDTPHQPLFPQGIVGPGHPYSNVIEYHFMRH